jgi:hypothetical protein
MVHRSIGGNKTVVWFTEHRFAHFAISFFRDAMILPVLDTFTSLFAGCVVFATLGYMSETSKLPIDDVVKQGIHLKSSFPTLMPFYLNGTS